MNVATPTTVADERVAEVLVAAQLLINEYGWVQHKFGDRRTGFCARGAIYSAAHDLFSEQGTVFVNRMSAAACKQLRRRIGHKNIPIWNDRSGRTQADVVHALGDARLDVLRLPDGEPS